MCPPARGTAHFLAGGSLWSASKHANKNKQSHPRSRRWLTLALTQEFPFPDALRLWDSLLSDPAGRSDCLLRLCTAMLLHVRQELLQVGTALDTAMLACLPQPQYWPVDQAVSGSAASCGELSKAAWPTWAGCSSVCSWAS